MRLDTHYLIDSTPLNTLFNGSFQEVLQKLLQGLEHGLLQPLQYPLDPSRRIFWLFLLSSLMLAIFATWCARSKKNCPQVLFRSFFSPRYWFNASTRQDVYWLFSNSLIRTVCLVPLFASHIVATVWVAGKLQVHFGDAPQLAWTPLAVATAYSVVFFIAEDASRFSLHWAMHRIPFLWRFHRIHHSATTLTPLTVHRVHTVEMMLYFIRGWCIFALVSGVFVYLFHGKVGAWDILGVDALGFLFNLLGANLRHSHIWLSFGPLEKIFISPAQHQLHHSKALEHRDINFGTCLAVWDKLARSWRSGQKKPKALHFGL